MAPEEERKMVKARQHLLSSEGQRELLETQYMSLRSHYVAASKRLAAARLGTDAVCLFLQDVVSKQQRTLGVRRARVQLLREAVAALEWREGSLSGRGKKGGKKGGAADKMEDGEGAEANIGDLFNLVDGALNTSENTLASDPSCADMLSFDAAATTGKKKGGTKNSNRMANTTMEITGSILPQTPYGVPLLVSILSQTQDRAAAASYGDVFGATAGDVVWSERGMPMGNDLKQEEERSRDLMAAELKKMTDAIDATRNDTVKLQKETNEIRVKSEKLSGRITIIRTETEAVLNRHHTVLETPEAKAASATLRSMEIKHEKEDAMYRQQNEAESQVNSDAEEEDEQEDNDQFQDATERDVGFSGENGGANGAATADLDDEEYKEPAKRAAKEAAAQGAAGGRAKGGRKKVSAEEPVVPAAAEPTFEDVQEVAGQEEEGGEEKPAEPAAVGGRGRGRGRGRGKRGAAEAVVGVAAKRTRRGAK
jgi:hypothetical protein